MRGNGSPTSLVGDDPTQIVAAGQDGDVIMLENTRFESGETSNDAALARALAGLADLFVLDAFWHRASGARFDHGCRCPYSLRSRAAVGRGARRVANIADRSSPTVHRGLGRCQGVRQAADHSGTDASCVRRQPSPNSCRRQKSRSLQSQDVVSTSSTARIQNVDSRDCDSHGSPGIGRSPLDERFSSFLGVCAISSPCVEGDALQGATV